MKSYLRIYPLLLAAFFMTGCDDDQGSDAIRLGVGAECNVNAECATEGTECLTQFRGGYCGLSPCDANQDCPSGSLCVVHDDGAHYCFLSCVTKSDCNGSRSIENESNCTSSVVFVEPTESRACVPPSGN